MTGERTTRQRQVVLEELRTLTTHPTAAELYDRVRPRLPRVSLATVYRSLEVLAERGLVQRLQMAGSSARFDATTEPHYHVRCTACGRVADAPRLPALPPEFGPFPVAGPGDFEILGHRLEWIGICPACRKRRTNRIASPGSPVRTTDFVNHDA